MASKKQHQIKKTFSKRGNRLDFTNLRLNSTTEFGKIKICTSIRVVQDDTGDKIRQVCNRKGAARWNETMNTFVVTHKAMRRLDGSIDRTDYCLSNLQP
jgi:hypothetical protein